MLFALNGAPQGTKDRNADPLLNLSRTSAALSGLISTAQQRTKDKMLKLITAALLLGSLMGCSVTSLQCGVDGDSSYVNLNSTPSTISQNSRNLAELCSFAYQENDNA